MTRSWAHGSATQMSEISPSPQPLLSLMKYEAYAAT